MENQGYEKVRKAVFIIFFSSAAVLYLGFSGCTGTSGGYSNESLFPEGINSVYVEMFDNQSFRRSVEYDLTDALSKRIEAESPYKVISNRNKADTLINGKIISIGGGILSAERETGRALEKEVSVNAVVSWKNLKTGELLIDSETVSATASYSEWQNQGFSYGATLAVNKLAGEIVELMESRW